MGYFGYDIVCYIEKWLDKDVKFDFIGILDIMLMVFDDIVVFDNLCGFLFVIIYVDLSEENVYECV